MRFLCLSIAIAVGVILGPSHLVAQGKRLILNVPKRAALPKVSLREPVLHRSLNFAYAVDRKTYGKLGELLPPLMAKADGQRSGTQQRLDTDSKILEIQFKMAAYERNLEETDFSRSWQQWVASGAEGDPPKLFRDGSTALFEEIKARSQRVVESLPESKVPMRFYFLYGLSNFMTGRDRNAARIYSLVIGFGGDSSSVADAMIALGDYHFAQEDYPSASNQYLAGLRRGGSQLSDWAYYKLGWLAFYSDRIPDLMKYWRKVLASPRVKSQALKDDILINAGYILGSSNNYAGAFEFFKGQRGKGANTALVYLARLARSQGDYRNSINMYRLSRAAHAFSPTKPALQRELIMTLVEGGFEKEIVKELGKLHSLYGSNSAFARRQKPGFRKRLDTFAMNEFLYHGKFFHKRSNDTSDPMSSTIANGIYRSFLRVYGKSPKANKAKLLLADLAVGSKKSGKAAKYYASIAKGSKAGSRNHFFGLQKMVDVALRGAEIDLVSLRRRIMIFPKKQRSMGGRLANAVSACNRFVKAYPKNRPVNARCLAALGEIYYYSGFFKPAVTNLLKASKALAGRRSGYEAAMRLVELVRNNRQMVQMVSAELLKISAYRRGDLGKQLGELSRAIKSNDFIKESEDVRRARGYRIQALKFPKGKDAPRFLALAANSFKRGGAPGESAKTLELLVVRYPNSADAPLALKELGLLSEQRLFFGKALIYYNIFAKRYKNHKDVPLLRARACRLMAALLQKGAFEYCQAAARLNPSLVVPAFDILIQSYASSGLDKKLFEAVTFASRSLRLPLSYKLRYYGLVFRKVKNESIRKKAAQSIEGLSLGMGKKVSDDLTDTVSEVWFRRADLAYARIKKIRFPSGNPLGIRNTLRAMKPILQRFTKSYRIVSKMRSPYWVAASFGRLGQGYEHLSRSLGLAISKTNFLGPDEAAMIKRRQLYKNQALRFYAQAKSMMEKSASYGPLTREIQEGYFRLKGEHIFFGDVLPKPAFVTSMIPKNLHRYLKEER